MIEKIRTDFETRKAVMSRNGVRYPEWYESCQDFQRWKKDMQIGLMEIGRSCGHKTANQSFKIISEFLERNERINLKEELRQLRCTQLGKIEDFGYITSMEDIHELEKLNYLHAIYSDGRLLRIFSDYIINRKYLAVNNSTAGSEETFKEKVFW